jgi:flagellar hook-length control protein FliK
VSEADVPVEAGKVPVAELERTALRLQIARANPGQADGQDKKDTFNQQFQELSSTLARAKLNGQIPVSPAGDSGAEEADSGRGKGEAAQSSAATAESAYRSQLRPAGGGLRLPGVASALEPLRPPAGPDSGTVTQGTVLSQHGSKPLSAGTPNASAGASAAGSEGSLGASEAENAAESGSRFVRAATLANASGAQRLQVLLQDDQLGRISLRLVDRAGLIQAVVRTDGARAAQLINESLPVLIESLAQRGLPASWMSSQGQSQEQPADPRQGQPRRQRQPGGLGSGGRRPQGSEAEFRVEVR